VWSKPLDLISYVEMSSNTPNFLSKVSFLEKAQCFGADFLMSRLRDILLAHVSGEAFISKILPLIQNLQVLPDYQLFKISSS
jgi:hypothetical protein